jgi:uncharacterized protein YegL
MRSRFTFALAAIFSLSITCLGQGVITPRRHIPVEQQKAPADTTEVIAKPTSTLPAALPVSSIKIGARISGQVATIKVEHLFRNDTDETLEGTYYFPVPEGASLLEFAVHDGDQRRVGRVREKEEARAAYSAGVTQAEDPAILEMTKRGWFESHVYPIPARSDKRIEVVYSQLLEEKDGVITFDYPLGKGYKKLKVPVGNVEVDIDLRADNAIKNLFSPTHPLDVNYDGDRHVTARIGTVGGDDAENFQLLYSLSDEDLGMSLLTHRREGEDGYFLLMLSPKVDFDERRISAKDVIFVIDVSGSMAGEKLAQAKGALTFGLRRTLMEEDRFNIISFSSGVNVMSSPMLPANRANIEQALQFVNALKAAGGTNINDSLVTAMRMFARSGRPQNLVFITDGQPSVSVTNIEQIIANAKEANAANARLYTFGVGSDVNRRLLERLAVENRGAEANIADKAELEGTISSFFAKVSRPVLSDLRVDFGPLQTANLHPAQLPDLYTRSQIRIFGRYRNPEDLRAITISLAGQMRERPERFEFNGLNFPLVTEDQEFLPKLWATERVNALLAEIRLYGEKPELKEEVMGLARKFNLVTPYTSMYVPTAGELAREQEGQPAIAREGSADVTLKINERSLGQPGLIPMQPPGPPSADAGSRGTGVGKARVLDSSVSTQQVASLPVQGRNFISMVQPSPGTVVDPSGAAIPGATVTIKDQKTGATRTVTTDDAGSYSVAGLPPGEYKIEVAATGFNNTSVNNVVVQPGQITAAGVALSVGAASETINVTSVAPAIDASISNTVSNVEWRKLRELPNLEPVDSLSRLAPGVDASKPDSRQSTAGTKDGELRFWINGGRFRANNHSLNGHDNNDIDGRPTISVNNFDSLETLNIVTTRGSGDVTATGASSINLLSRTGTNEFHGTAFDYYLNRRFGALSPLERRSGLDRAPAFRRNLFGGTLGGPIRRDRIFFFGAFQGENEDSSRFTDSTSSFLTPTERGLADLARVFGNSPTILDLIGRGPVARAIGEQRFGRSMPILVLGTPIEFGQLLRIIPSSAEGYEAGGRFDFLVTNRDTLKASYWWDSRRASNAVGRHSAGFLSATDNRAQLGGLQWNHTLSPRSTNELGLAFNRSRLSLDSDEPENLGVSIGVRGLPYGPSPLLPAGHISTLFGISDTLTHVSGRHNIKIGAQLRRRLTSFDYLPGAGGNFSYPSFEDFVMDRPVAVVLSVGDHMHRFEETIQHYFIDDAWRARSNLTFTMGLGYENGGQPLNGLADRIRVRESNASTALFDPSTAIEMRTIDKVDRDNNNFTPRLGFAYTPNFRVGGLNLFGYDQTVIRAGASISYDQTAYRPLADVAVSAPNVMSAVVTPDSGVALPTFPDLPGTSSLRSLFSTNPSIFARTELDREFRTPFSAAWHLAISRELNEKATLEIGYVGSRGVGLIRALDANPLLENPQRGPTRVYASTGRSIYHSLQARADLRLTQGVTGGIGYTLSKLIDDVPGSAAQIAGGIGSSSTLTLPELHQFAQNPADSTLGERALSDLDRRHSLVGHLVWTLPFKRLQSGVEERLLGGWQVSGIVELRSGTPFTPLQHLGYSPASSAIFASAFSDRLGAVRPFAGNAAAAADTVAFSNAANQAFGFFLNSDGTRFISPTGFIVADRSGFRAGSTQDARFIYNDFGVERRAIGMGLAPDAFGQTYAAGRPFGNVGRNSLVAPGLANIDFALVKTTKLSEKVSLQLRAEAFNLLNHPNRARPNFVLENAGGFGFGDLGEVDSTPRRIRFGLKLIF